MLTTRQEKVLEIIIREYVKNVTPVGSKLICDELKCSSATVRNEMAVLENKGYLEKTHISSGRVPSEEGYRYYVDNLMKPKEMTGEDMLKLQTIFNYRVIRIFFTILDEKKYLKEKESILNQMDSIMEDIKRMLNLKEE